MSHPSNIVHCTGPHDPHALDGISRRHRSGDLDQPCPECGGRGWIETGDDMVPSHDIARSEAGHPMWTVRLDPSDDRE